MRLFIAINFDENILKALTGFQRELKDLGVRGNFSKRENLHITLAFIGEYNDPDKVLEAMAQVTFDPFDIILEGVGNFGDIFWAGLSENKDLAGYVKRLRKELELYGIPFDRKRFSPHITLIRRADYRGGEMVPAENPPEGRMRAEEVSLMRSDRGKQGMIYTELGSVRSNT